ncbi:FHA domain-containing protein [Natroniella acetigena]|uniref:FHA domain-containing protein n=1 Tax=Natroniella acetigena TaxID=52004 RepID=UPI00200AF2CB|nr:FHA domain-containing protein [Natroniella acetigena]MCK8827044.1 FHA domain-containing protein [Natroniella acetigena]
MDVVCKCGTEFNKEIEGGFCPDCGKLYVGSSQSEKVINEDNRDTNEVKKEKFNENLEEMDKDLEDFNVENKKKEKFKLEGRLEGREAKGRSENELEDSDLFVREIILEDEPGENTKTWSIPQNENSLLIGKVSSKGPVDIDLRESKNAEYVSRRHAKLIKIKGKWYISILQSVSNDSYGKFSGSSNTEKLVPGEEYKINSGDIVYLGNVKLRFE